MGLLPFHRALVFISEGNWRPKIFFPVEPVANSGVMPAERTTQVVLTQVDQMHLNYVRPLVEFFELVFLDLAWLPLKSSELGLEADRT
jgi:hypothetical protein